MTDHVEQIKSRLDLVEVISGYLKVQKSGANFKARCPFHNEKTPSFHISPERQIWHCFGCAKGGDMFSFVKDIEGVEFPEALRILAAKAGVELQRFDASGQTHNHKTVLYDISELSTKFFEKQLHQSNVGQHALKYLCDRGVLDETTKEFRLGFAPNDWHALGMFLEQAGYARKDIVAAGVVVEKDGRVYDRFRSRITFPIADVNGQIVGFSARAFVLPGQPEDQGAKYINTPQTLIYDKSRVLYGLSNAKTEVKRADKCVLVEGNMDALMSYQGGVPHTVATSGTALTPFHLRLLQRYTTHLDFCFDTDQAGALATRRGIGLALAQNFDIRVVEIGDETCKDPADYVQKHGTGWATRVAESKPVIEFYMEKARKSLDTTSAESKKLVVQAVAPFIRRLVSQVERSHWVSQLAAFLRTKEDAIEADLAAAKDDLASYNETASEQVSSVQVAPSKPHPDAPIDILSEALLSVVLRQPALFQQSLSAIAYDYIDPRVADVLRKLAATKADPFDLSAFMQQHSPSGPEAPSGAYALEFAYLRAQEVWQQFTDEALLAEFHSLLQKIKKRSIVSRLASLEFDIREAEARRDSQKINELILQFTALAGELNTIQEV